MRVYELIKLSVLKTHNHAFLLAKLDPTELINLHLNTSRSVFRLSSDELVVPERHANIPTYYAEHACLYIT